MATLEKYRQAVLTVITPPSTGRYFSAAIKHSLIVDKENDKYVLTRTGWTEKENHYALILHLEIINGMVHVFANNTDREIEEELVEEGVKRSDIVEEYVAPAQREISNSNF